MCHLRGKTRHLLRTAERHFKYVMALFCFVVLLLSFVFLFVFFVCLFVSNLIGIEIETAPKEHQLWLHGFTFSCHRRLEMDILSTFPT